MADLNSLPVHPVGLQTCSANPEKWDEWNQPSHSETPRGAQSLLPLRCYELDTTNTQPDDSPRLLSQRAIALHPEPTRAALRQRELAKHRKQLNTPFRNHPD